MAGIEAAKDAVAVVPEAEGRVRWQARWHELERALRAAEGRLEALGLDRDGAAYYLIAPWGEIAAQPSGASAGIGAELTFVGGGAAAAAGGGKKRKRASKGGAGDEDTADAADDDVEMTDAAAERDSEKTPAADDAGELRARESAWGAYADADEVRALAAALNPSGFREGTLWSQIERRFGAPTMDAMDAKDGDAEDAKDAKEESEEGLPPPKEGLPPLSSLTAVPPRPDPTWIPPRPPGAASEADDAVAAAVDAAKSELLALDAALPTGGFDGRAMCQVRGSTRRRAAWRRMLDAATTPLQIAMATCLLEASLRREWVSPAWLPWSPPAPALRAAAAENRDAAMAAAALRVAALRRAINWPKPTRAREEVAPAPTLTREERGTRRAAAAAAAAMAAAIAASEADMEQEAEEDREREDREREEENEAEPEPEPELTKPEPEPTSTMPEPMPPMQTSPAPPPAGPAGEEEDMDVEPGVLSG